MSTTAGRQAIARLSSPWEQAGNAETAAAHKDIDAVMKAQPNLVERVHTLKQVVGVKG